MNGWSLPGLLSGLHEDIERRLAAARALMGHPVSKGDASESIWLDLLSEYLPRRYQVAKAFVVDSNGEFSDQIDLIVFDRQYSPFILKSEGQSVIPAESVYAVLEAKQNVDSRLVEYAQRKAASVRRLHRTSLPVPHVGGTSDPKPPARIIGGLLALECEWKPALGKPLADALSHTDSAGRLDLGCIAAHGIFTADINDGYVFSAGGKPATAFLLELIAQLQAVATVPMIDVRAYSRWLA
jgi:hypothetical protein